MTQEQRKELPADDGKLKYKKNNYFNFIIAKLYLQNISMTVCREQTIHFNIRE